ncbi:MAG: isoprenylcysteine carboxylmethyltransferase family protein, partial [Bacteroidota bacterium]|nr:isoprenylcysteine carboxylmethyltransferase family protein [Bacteroidota bacterium]
MKTSLFIKQVLGTILFFAVIFISAGYLCYWQGLVYAGTGVVMLILNYTVLRLDNALMEERSKPGEGVKKWDKMILGLSFLTTLAMYVVVGLDSGRFHWSPEFHWGLYALGIVLNILGQLIFLFAQKQNKFFSSTVRVQTDRGHTVCESGLYKIVRHPGYLGMIIQYIGFPFLFGSLWSLIPIGVLIILKLIRTSLEDTTLKHELNGYIEYTFKTKYRLIP